MEDDKIKELFADFKPDLSSDFQFFEKLERNMEAVEIVKESSAALRHRNRVAVAVAGVAGFLMGVILTLVFPLIGYSLSSALEAIRNISVSPAEGVVQIAVLSAIVLVACVTSVNAYEITLSRLKRKESI